MAIRKRRMGKKRRTMRRRRIRRRSTPIYARSRGRTLLFKNTRLRRRQLRLTYSSKNNRTAQTGVVPAEVYRALPYYDQAQLLFTSVSLTSRMYRLSSMFDVDFTGVGHQPRGFDQLAQLYENYKVYAARIDVLFTTKDTTTDSFMCFVHAFDPIKATSSWNVIDLNENPCGPIRMGVLTNSNRQCTLSLYVPLHSVMGVSRREWNTNDEYGAAVTHNPVVNVFASIGAYTLDGSTNTAGIDYHVNITLFSRLFRPKQLLQS